MKGQGGVAILTLVVIIAAVVIVFLYAGNTGFGFLGGLQPLTFSNDVVAVSNKLVSDYSPHVGEKTTIEFSVRNQGRGKVSGVEVHLDNPTGFTSSLKCGDQSSSQDTQASSCKFDLEQGDGRDIVISLTANEGITQVIPVQISYYVQYPYKGSREIHIPVVNSKNDLPKNQHFFVDEPGYGPIQVSVSPPDSRPTANGGSEIFAVSDIPIVMGFSVDNVGGSSSGNVQPVLMKGKDFTITPTNLVPTYCDKIDIQSGSLKIKSANVAVISSVPPTVPSQSPSSSSASAQAMTPSGTSASKKISLASGDVCNTGLCGIVGQNFQCTQNGQSCTQTCTGTGKSAIWTQPSCQQTSSTTSTTPDDFKTGLCGNVGETYQGTSGGKSCTQTCTGTGKSAIWSQCQSTSTSSSSSTSTDQNSVPTVPSATGSGDTSGEDLGFQVPFTIECHFNPAVSGQTETDGKLLINFNYVYKISFLDKFAILPAEIPQIPNSPSGSGSETPPTVPSDTGSSSSAPNAPSSSPSGSSSSGLTGSSGSSSSGPSGQLSFSTDKSSYSSSQSVQITGTAGSGQPVTGQLFDSGNNLRSIFQVSAGSSGSFSASLSIPANSASGTYTVKVTSGGTSATKGITVG